MNTRFGRTIRRAGIGTAAFVAASAFAAPAAFAETTSDLELNVQGTTLAGGSAEKIGTFTVANKGPQSATNVGFKIDASGLDKTKVTFSFDGGDCAPVADVWDCQYGGTIDSGEAWDNFFKLTKVGNATGDAGTLKISISHPQDENTANNEQSVNVTLSAAAGVDLAAYADDIYQTTSESESRDSSTPVQPGATSFFWADVVNWGDQASTAIDMSIKLPQGVTFVGSEPDCDYTTGSTETICHYTGEAGAIAAGKYNSYLFEVKVADSVAGPVVLGDGVFQVVDVPAPGPAARAARATPDNVITNQDAAAVPDLDPADNTDEFSAYVAKKDGGQGGGLPVTGTQIGLIAGVGGAAVVGGALLLVASRRRRATI